MPTNYTSRFHQGLILDLGNLNLLLQLNSINVIIQISDNSLSLTSNFKKFNLRKVG